MSDQGDAGQWRPASRNSGQYSVPDDTTGPLPAVSEDAAAASGFPPVGGKPDAWSADEDEASTGGFPSAPPPGENPSAPSAQRAPFEPPDQPAAPPPSESPAPLTDDAWSSYRRPAGEWPSEPADPPSPGRQESETSESTPPFGAEMPDAKPYESESSFGYGAWEEKRSKSGESSFGYGAAKDKAYESAEAPHRQDTRPPDAADPFSANSSGQSPAEEQRSFGEATPAARSFRRPGEPYSDDRRVTAEEQAAENEFFASDEHPPIWDKVVAPTGPPPQPGKPSSGNLRLPEWMRDESNGAGHSDSYGYEEEGRSKRSLLIGVGVLVVGLVAVAGVYLLKGGGDSKPVSHTGAPTQPSQPPSQAPVQPPSENPQPDKVLAKFRGAHTKPAGRVVDQRSGLSYPRLGKPWGPPPNKSPMTELGFSASQFSVTEKAGAQPKRWARLMSAGLGGAEKDAYTGPGSERDAATQVAEAYEARMYGFGHRKKLLASQPLNIGGHKGWLVGYYLTYHRPGVKATGDVVTVAMVDTGRKAPGVLFMSVPNTHKKLWPDVNYVMHSMKVA
jgi:hypothetical protein